MLDITNCKQLWGDYEGLELKFDIEYNGNKYMVKKPDPSRQTNQLNTNQKQCLRHNQTTYKQTRQFLI